jgi:hypothetical protein
MRDDGRQHRPVDLRARHQVFFQIIGMDFDQTGNQVIAFPVVTAVAVAGIDVLMRPWPVLRDPLRIWSCNTSLALRIKTGAKKFFTATIQTYPVIHNLS